MTGANLATRDIRRPQDRPPASEPRTADFGLIVGVDNYPRFRSLCGAVRDAKRFHKWLRDGNGGNVAEDHARLVLSKLDPLSPLKKQVDDELNEIIRRADALHGGHRLYFHFSGHGIGLRRTDDVALLLAEWSEKLGGLALSTNEYRGNLVGMGLFDEVVISLDCCRTAVKGAVVWPPVLSCTPEPRCATQYLVAYATTLGSWAVERSAPDCEWEGVFTHRLLFILRGQSGLTVEQLKSALECESNAEGQQAEVVYKFRSGNRSRFGSPGMKHPVKITFNPARLDKWVTIGWYRGSEFHVEHRYKVDGSLSWIVPLEAGRYKLDDGEGTSRLFEHPEQLLANGENDETVTVLTF